MPLLGRIFLLSDDGNLTYPKKIVDGKLLMLVQFFKITFNHPTPSLFILFFVWYSLLMPLVYLFIFFNLLFLILFFIFVQTMERLRAHETGIFKKPADLMQIFKVR